MMYIETLPATVWDWKRDGSPETAQESIELLLKQIKRNRVVEKIEKDKTRK